MLSQNSSFATFTIPSFAGPDDAAITLTGEQLPPCMVTASYASAILFRPAGSVSQDTPYYFIAQGSTLGQQYVHFGALVYDQAAGVCGLVVFGEVHLVRFGVAGISVFLRTGQIAQVGSGTWTNPVVEDFDNYIGTYDSTTTVNLNGAVAIAGSNGYTVFGVSAPWGPFSTCHTLNAGNAAGTAAAETAIPSATWATEPSLTFINGRLYRVTVVMNGFHSTAAYCSSRQRIRKGSASVVGTLLASHNWQYPAGPGGTADQLMTKTWVCYIKNTSGGNVSTELSLTNDLLAGATFTLYGDGTFPLTMNIEDIGATADHADLAAITVSV